MQAQTDKENDYELSSLRYSIRCPARSAQGLIWGLMAIGVYITFRILDVADLTVDGSIATGGAVRRHAHPRGGKPVAGPAVRVCLRYAGRAS